MSLAAYKVLHLLSAFLLFAALGGLTVHAIAGRGDRERGKKLAAATHGIALVLLLVTGFGALARLALSNPADWPGWVWAKVVVWLALGAALAARRFPGAAGLFWWLWPVLGGVAAWLALYKPF
ncbi:MAG TPA: hypothetical protein VHM02_12150 [Thermoanaerobaculia bacterium]|nr:hypothetical protein [Thermoanaerobaculia bacterium]